MSGFTKTVLYTDAQGHARFREDAIPLNEGTPQSRLSALLPANGYQLRESPVGFRSEFHCTPKPQWVFILGGIMEIGLRTAPADSSGPASTSTRPTPCLPARPSMRRCTATGAARSATSRW